jgi:hypothetical protein
MGKRIIEYKIVVDYTPEGLESNVNMWISQGYIPTGDLIVENTENQNSNNGGQFYPSSTMHRYIQVMKKYNE